MGLRVETRVELRKGLVTKIFRQPMDQDITTLKKELIAIVASTPMALGGGNHGHSGLIVEPANYLTVTGGKAFTIPAHPGIYPASLTTSAFAGTRAKEEANHKELTKC